jgi:hypothetical protein
LLTRDEVKEKLKILGVDITVNTLRRYEKQRLISEATRGLPGLAGRSTRYPNESVYEAYAAWALINGYNTAPCIPGADKFFESQPKFSPITVRLARNVACFKNEEIITLFTDEFGLSKNESSTLLKDPRVSTWLAHISESWKANIEYAKNNLPFLEKKQKH